MRAADRLRTKANSATVVEVLEKPASSTISSPAHSDFPAALPEPFVDANRAAEFLFLRPRRVLELARQGALPAHPLGIGQRKVWRFRLSELAAAISGRANYRWQSPAPKEIRNGAW